MPKWSMKQLPTTTLLGPKLLPHGRFYNVIIIYPILFMKTAPFDDMSSYGHRFRGFIEMSFFTIDRPRQDQWIGS